MLGGGLLLPIHWSTFNMAVHPWDEPLENLLRLADGRGVQLLTPMLGRRCRSVKMPTPTGGGDDSTPQVRPCGRASPASSKRRDEEWYAGARSGHSKMESRSSGILAR